MSKATVADASQAIGVIGIAMADHMESRAKAHNQPSQALKADRLHEAQERARVAICRINELERTDQLIQNLIVEATRDRDAAYREIDENSLTSIS